MARSKGLSPTQRTLRALRGQGRLCDIVERWLPHAGPFGVRRDCFNFIDIIALDSQRGIVAIQSTGQDFAGHVRKLTDSDCTEAVIEWLKCGGKVEVWGWRKLLVRRGGKAKRWQPRVRELTLDDFPIEEKTP